MRRRARWPIRAWAERALFEGPSTSLAEIDGWRRKERTWPGTGIACGNVVAIDIDFAADVRLAEMVRSLAIDVFGETPFERQGAFPKVALIYRAAGPIASLSLKSADGSNDGLDVLAELRQIVSYGIHWKTLKPYQWIGAESPLTATPDDAPEVTQAQVDEFVRRLRGLVDLSTSGGRRKTGQSSESGAQIVRGPDGRVTDGREMHLTRIVYSVALDAVSDGEPLTPDRIAATAWETFARSTVLDDARWFREDARVKASALLDRARRGLVDLRPMAEAVVAVAPTYPDARRPVAAAEEAVRGIVAEFFAQHVPAWVATRKVWEKAKAEAKEAGIEPPEKPIPTSWGARVETAIGKTAEAIAVAARAAASGVTVVYGVPTHRLGSELIARFAAQGVTARVYRGYESPDPDWTDRAMCMDLPAVRDAKDAGVSSIEGAVCEIKAASTDNGVPIRCAFFDQCGMTRQRRSTPDVWVVPHALLLSAKPKYLPIPDAIVIDEGFAMGAIPDKPARFSLDAMDRSEFTVPTFFSPFSDASNDLEIARKNLLRALRDHPEDGPLQRDILVRHQVTEANAANAYRLEWQRIIDPEIQPDMDPAARQERVNTTGRHNVEVKKWAGIWEELRTFLAGDADQSGRLALRFDKETHSLNLERRSLATVRGSWAAPALLIDATLPDPSLIAPVLGHEVEVKADITATWSPFGHVRQIIEAPITAKKLGLLDDPEADTERRVIGDLVRLIGLRAALVGHRVVVVIGPLRLIEKLQACGLPENVETGHFGGVAGIDRWADAAGLICIGRLLPGPLVTEPLAAVMTGRMPEGIPEKDGVTWYDRIEGGVRLASGEGVAVTHWSHPDPVVEAIRWQICEANLIQAVGRLRALRRPKTAPYFLDMVGDVPLPLSVDSVVTWDEARVGAWAGMAAEGVLLSSAADVMACFPDLAPTRQTAREMALPTLVVTSIMSLSVHVTTNVAEVTYKRAGRFPPAAAILLPNAPDDLKTWLSERIGAIEWVRVKPAEASQEATAPIAASLRLRAGAYDPALATSFCLVAEVAAATRQSPVKAEVARLGSDTTIRFPPLIAGRAAMLRAARAVGRARALEAVL